jgi:ABC-type Na+ efflux pump permease subunit
MLDIIIVLVIVVVLVVALGYSSQFLELLNSGKSEALSRLVSGDMRETFRSMNIAVVVITVILLAAIISAFIASAVKSSETAAQVQSRRPGSY